MLRGQELSYEIVSQTTVWCDFEIEETNTINSDIMKLLYSTVIKKASQKGGFSIIRIFKNTLLLDNP